MSKQELVVNIHDIYSAGLLRLVSPEELVEALKQNGLDVQNEGFGSDEGRVDFGDFTINGHKIYYQVCGLFAGDEHITFPKRTQKTLIDKILAILKLTMAQGMISYHNRQINSIMTPGEAVAKMDNSLSQYRDKELQKAEKAITEAKKVLEGKQSFFDKELKNYKRSKTLGEVFLHMAVRMTILDNIVKEKMKDQDETLVYLVKEYLEWRIKSTGFENLYKSFPEKIQNTFEGLSTSPSRGWGPLNDKQLKEVKHLKKAVSNKSLITTAMNKGDEILPELQKRLSKSE